MYDVVDATTTTVATAWTQVVNNAATATVDYAPTEDLTAISDVYDSGAGTWLAAVDVGTGFRMTMNFELAPASGFTQYVEIGLDTDADGTPDLMQTTVYHPQGTSTSGYHTVSFDYFVDDNITANGFQIYARAGGASVTFQNVRMVLTRTMKAS
jgi:hypothetical protein